jgi:hypothetical protein
MILSIIYKSSAVPHSTRKTGRNSLDSTHLDVAAELRTGRPNCLIVDKAASDDNSGESQMLIGQGTSGMTGDQSTVAAFNPATMWIPQIFRDIIIVCYVTVTFLGSHAYNIDVPYQWLTAEQVLSFPNLNSEQRHLA